MKQVNKMELAQDALNRGDSEALFALFTESQNDIIALLRVQAAYANMEGKLSPTGDMETVKVIAMEAMSLAKLVISISRGDTPNTGEAT